MGAATIPDVGIALLAGAELELVELVNPTELLELTEPAAADALRARSAMVLGSISEREPPCDSASAWE